MTKTITMIFIFSTMLTSLFSSHDKYEAVSEKNPDIEKRFTYLRFDYGLPYLFSLNYGKRIQSNHHGFDISAGTVLISPYIYAIHTDIKYNIFPKPNPQSQYYFGVGLNSTLFFYHYCLFHYQPEIVIGKEYQKKGKNRFLELKLGYYGCGRSPHYEDPVFLEGRIYKLPTICLCHGVEF